MHKNCKCQQDVLDDEQKAYLKRIGMSKEAVRLYNMLLVLGPLSAQDAATHTLDFPSAEYRLFYDLEEKGLVRRLPGRPRRFEALPTIDGLQTSYVQQEKELQALLTNTLGGADELASIIIGRQKVYEAYITYAKKAQKDICIYAIGVAYSKELAKTQADAVKRGVRIRHIVQEVKAGNYYVVSRWLKLGIALRTLKRPRGYHVTIIDNSHAIVTFSDPQDTERRVSMLTTDKNTIAIFQSQFESLWSAAKKVPYR